MTESDPISPALPDGFTPARKDLRFGRQEGDPGAREARRRRFRRRSRRAYIRSVYSLPSLATLGNAISGFAAIYIASLDPETADQWVFQHRFMVAAYLVFLAMFFDAIDGRLARFTRHTTDFGGQLDSLADVVSFGVAPAFIALKLFHAAHFDLRFFVGRLVWGIGALYMSCAALRLARFNVSNEHGEQHHFSFLGLPSPGAGAAVAGMILIQQDLAFRAGQLDPARYLANICVGILPLLVLTGALLMVSAVRYPHMVNRHLRGRHPIGRLVAVLIGVLLIVTVHRYTIGVAALAYMFWGPIGSASRRYISRPAAGPMPPVQ